METLPKGWRRARLGEVCEINPRRPADLKRTDSEPTSFVPMAAVDERSGAIARPEVKPFGSVKKGYTYFGEGDVLFAKITPCMQNGKHAIARDLIGRMGFGTTEFHVLRPGSSVLSEWVHLFVRQPTVLVDATAHFTGAVGQQRVPEGYLSALEIPLPPVPEQKRITTVLAEQMAAVERARAAAEARLEAARALPTAYFRESFHGITPLTADFTRDPAPPGWKWHRLTGIAKLESGHTPSRYHPEWWGGDIPWIALPDIRALDGKTAHDTAEYTNPAGIENSSARILPASTVVLSRTASVGFVTIMGRPMATSQDFVNWVCGPDLLPAFLAFLLRTSRSYIRSLSSGAVHKTVYMPTLKAFEVCIPPVPEQRRIVSVLERQVTSVGKGYAAVEAQLAAIGDLPPALLRRAFKGDD